MKQCLLQRYAKCRTNATSVMQNVLSNKKVVQMFGFYAAEESLEEEL